MESQSNVYLRGIGITGYRSIRDTQILGPLSKVTLIAGRNNAGKSNFLRFVGQMLQPRPPERTWADRPQPEGAALSFDLAFPRPAMEGPLKTHARTLMPLVMSPLVKRVSDSNDMWMRFSLDDPKAGWKLDEAFLADVLNSGDARQIGEMSLSLTGTGSGGRPDDLRRVFDLLFPLELPTVETVHAFRQISNQDGATLNHDHSGSRLIERLVQLKDPDPEHFDSDRAKFDAITEFARKVFDDPLVEIQIPSDRKSIAIRHQGRTLPLDSLGTGIHQVIILAAAASTLDNTVVCIEEPEVHLHPVLQRKLIRYLCEETSNQYLIATHSAHVLDYERASIFHVRNDPEEGTVASPAVTPQEISDICGDLGYRASDLLQANAVIWVEGPSDRLYVQHWIEKLCPGEFVEGIHYSIMFYGGSLLRHLTAEDQYVSDFISLRRLNRHSAILIDSDKTRPRESIGETKKRVQEEFDRDGMPGFAWVTDCRTIENYVPSEVLTEAVKAAHPKTAFAPPIDKWADPLPIDSPSKVRIAREACSRWDGDLDRKLAERVLDIAKFIRTANCDDSLAR